MNATVSALHSNPGRHRAESRRGTLRWRLGRLGAIVLVASVGGAGIGFSSISDNALKGSERDTGAQLSEMATSSLHDLAETAMTTYYTALKNHPKDVHIRKGGTEATIEILGGQGPISETVESTGVMPGPDGELVPNPDSATSITTSRLAANGVVRATLTPTGATILTPESTFEKKARTSYRAGENPVTRTYTMTMGAQPKAQKPDQSLAVAQNNVQAAITSISAVNNELLNLVTPGQSAEPPAPPATIVTPPTII